MLLPFNEICVMYDMMRLKKTWKEEDGEKADGTAQTAREKQKKVCMWKMMCGQAITVNDTVISGGFMGLYFGLVQ